MTDIEEARRKLEEAQFQMIETYLDEIRRNYKSLPERKKQELMRGLEALINDDFEQGQTKILKYFDESEAAIIRIRAKITQAELGRLLGLSQGVIAKYERGVTIPTPYTKENQKKYLEWLKQQGYNPYNI